MKKLMKVRQAKRSLLEEQKRNKPLGMEVPSDIFIKETVDSPFTAEVDEIDHFDSTSSCARRQDFGAETNDFGGKVCFTLNDLKGFLPSGKTMVWGFPKSLSCHCFLNFQNNFGFKESNSSATYAVVCSSKKLFTVEEIKKGEVTVPSTAAQEIPSPVQQIVSDEKYSSAVVHEKSLNRKRIRTRNVAPSKQQKVLYYQIFLNLSTFIF